MNPIQHEGIRIATGAFRTSPIDSILCNVGELPLQIIRKINTVRYIIKTSNIPHHITATNLHLIHHHSKAKTPITIYENYSEIKDTINLDIDPINKITFS